MKRTKLDNLSALPFNEVKSTSHEMLVLCGRLFPPEEGIVRACVENERNGGGWKGKETGGIKLKM